MRIVMRNYEYLGVVYPARITFKRVRNLSARFHAEDQSLRVTVPSHYYFAMGKVDDFIRKALPRLVKRTQAKEKDYENGELYVFGEKRAVGELSEEEINQYQELIKSVSHVIIELARDGGFDRASGF